MCLQAPIRLQTAVEDILDSEEDLKSKSQMHIRQAVALRFLLVC